MKKLREITIVLWLILSLFSVLVIVNIPAVKATGDPQDTGNGYWETPHADWVIQSWEVKSHENKKIVVNGDLLVYGKLTLSNVTLQMNETTDDKGWNITVDDDGELNVINGSVITTDPITAAQSPDPYEFRIDGTALIENSTVEKMKGLSSLEDGIRIYSDDVVIRNSTIQLSYGNGVYVENGEVIITNSEIIDNTDFGVYLLSSSNNSFIGNNISNNYAGL
jgi:parallel beta-helix repeat protein